MSSQIELQAAQLQHSGFGQNGAILLTNTTEITGKFRIILVLADAVFATLTSDITKNGTAVLAVAADFGTVTKGTTLYGHFTTIKLTSGTVLVYK
jgi:hypothetical protein